MAGSEEGCIPGPPGFRTRPQSSAVGQPRRPGAPEGALGTPALTSPRPPEAAWQPGSWQLPKICCLGLFALL